MTPPILPHAIQHLCPHFIFIGFECTLPFGECQKDHRGLAMMSLEEQQSLRDFVDRTDGVWFSHRIANILPSGHAHQIGDKNGPFRR